VIIGVCQGPECVNQVTGTRAYCSSACRQAAYRFRKFGAPARPVARPTVVVPINGAGGLGGDELHRGGEIGLIEQEVRRALDDLNGGNRVAGAVAVVVARQLDRTVGLAGLGPAAQLLLNAMEKAQEGIETADPLDDIRGNVVRKLR
jgi:hypothetical protein